MHPLVKEKLKNLPGSAGVYLMKDHAGVIIYVGKARNLRNRVSSYFFGEADHVKTRALVSDVADFELMLTRTEVEALLLERTLIRHHQPRYNINLRDDKEYPFVRIDFNMEWPRIEKVRRRKEDGATYVGPFGNAGLLNVMLRNVFRIFPLVRCTPHEFKNAKRPCTYYHMNLCLGPCTLPVEREQYVEHLQHALAVLQGKNRDLAQRLNQRMQEAAEAEQYERAGNFRDQLIAIKAINERQSAVVKDIEDGDAIALVHEDDRFAIHVVTVRGRLIIGGENFLVRSAVATDEEALGSFLLQYYDSRECPAHLVLPFAVPDIDGILQVATKAYGVQPRAYVAEKGESRSLVHLAKKNAAHHMEQAKLTSRRGLTELEMVRDLLRLPDLPQRIECIDISNLGETAIVASNVCFIGGKPAKDQYRHYNIETTGGQDDFGAIREVVRRRIERGLREDDWPQLLVIDGGKGQLSAALQAAAAFPNLALPIVALAKSRIIEASDTLARETVRSEERVFIPDQDVPIPLPEGSPPYRVLTRLRDEAHRFAINFHREKRTKVLQGSLLDRVNGIGPVLKKRLLERFEGLQGLRLASLEQLLTVKGMRENVAVELISRLKESEDQERMNA